ncbi:hypothetical protein BDZ97DRAFT_1350311 [Flammula alnicola]|nr:hypothetical protein BDZ97DRAFT_1350311 [Flammula alnicola]
MQDTDGFETMLEMQKHILLRIVKLLTGSKINYPSQNRAQPPRSQDGRDANTKTPIAATPSTQSSNNPAHTRIWGVKIHRQGEFPSFTSTGPRARFVTEHFEPTHPIFKVGELCPLTVVYGIPIVVYSPTLSVGWDYPVKPGEKCDTADNQPAVYLRIETHNGFAPFRWQIMSPGPCYAVRQDKQPLTKELLETMYKFHASILDTDYFLETREGNPPYAITPEVFQDFSEKYWKEQKKAGRTMSSGDGR